ncbi:MAG TPA: hypothetical protein PK239_16780, partial [Chitinophagales bacterium]|nr:hypothetical protein [Chitinophagales bacterium]
MKLFSSIIHSCLLYKILCGILFCSCILQAQTPKYFTSTPIWGINLNCNGIRIAQTSYKNYVISGNTLDPINTKFRVFIANINQVGEFTGFQEFIKQDTLSHTGSMATNYNKKRLLNAGAVIDTNNTSYHAYYLLTDFNGNLINENIDSLALAGYESIFYAASNAFDGGYIVAGQRSAVPIVSGGGYVPYHPYVVKIDSLGNRQWDKLYTAHGPPL